jgi:outer membrane protein assembly factor BamB
MEPPAGSVRERSGLTPLKARIEIIAIVVPLVLTLVLADVPSADGQERDWPQWRGPSRDGTVTVPDGSGPLEWPDQLTREWRVEVGAGYAAPIMVGDRVFVFSREGEEEVLRALEGDGGAEVWSTRYPAPYSYQAAAAQHGPGPKATPTYDAGRIFTLGLGGVVTAFDATSGDILWQVPEPDVVPLYGTAASPLVDGDQVIVHVGGDGRGALTAFDVATGTVRWAWDGDGPGYASAQMTMIGGVRQVITLSQAHVVGVDAGSGALLWEVPFTTGFTQNIIDPVIAGDVVIVSGYQERTFALRVVPDASGWSSSELWSNSETAMYMSNPVLTGGMLFGLTERNSGQFFLLDVEDGETVWTGPPRQAENAAILRIDDGPLLVLEDDGELIVGSVDAMGLVENRRYSVAESATWAQPAISGNRIAVKDVSGVTLWNLGAP